MMALRVCLPTLLALLLAVVPVHAQYVQQLPWNVGYGGTGLTAGTSGGILGFTATGTLASSVVLTANALVLGGGAGATPTPLGSLGTTTTLLHGNAAGAPTFGAVSLTADVSGILPGTNGGTNSAFFQVSGPTTSLKTYTFPDASSTVAVTSNTLAVFAATTSAQLAGVISDETGSGGAVMFADKPTLLITAGTGTVAPGLTFTEAAHTALTASTERFDTNWNSARTVQWATGALATQRFHVFQAPTIGFVGASTVTDTATVAITGAPVKGTNATLTNTHALLIQGGAVSTATNAYGLTVNAPTGATNNYAAAFLGGNVGIGTTSPNRRLNVYHASVARISIDSPATAEPGYELYNAGVLSSLIFRPASTNDLVFYLGSERVRITSAGDVGRGTSSPLAGFHTAETGAASVRGILNAAHPGANPSGARFIGRKSRGTEGAPTAILTGDILADVVAEGYDGTSYLQMAAISLESTGTIAATRVPTRILFKTATDAAPSVLTTALTLDSNQAATFASTISTVAPAGGAGPAWKLGPAAVVSPTAPNRTIAIDVGGTTYYLAAKLTND